MSSRLVVNQIQDSAAKNIDTTFVTNGSAKAWCSIDGDSTVNDSFNISGTVENGNGDNTYNITNAMENATYAVSGMSKSDDNGGVRAAFMQFAANQTSIATGFFRLTSQYDNTNVREAEYASTIVHGELA